MADNLNPTQTVEALLKDAKEKASTDRLTAILELLLAKEARLAEQEKAVIEKQANLDSKRKEDSNQMIRSRVATQKKCALAGHLKGKGGVVSGLQREDPCLSMHRYADGDVTIKCLLCKTIWRKGDTREHFFVGISGNPKKFKIPNWTGQSWQDAVKMMGRSSNKPTGSEAARPNFEDTMGIGTEVDQMLEEVPNIPLAI
jgi:hypothetical protein